jgi:hypothetical protein
VKIARIILKNKPDNLDGESNQVSKIRAMV